MRWLRRALGAVAVSLLLLSMGNSCLHLSPIELAAAPYRYDLVTWEITHLPDKWLHKVWSFMPWNSRSQEEKLADLEEFFRLGEDIRSLEGEMAAVRARSPRNGPSLLARIASNDEDGRENRLEELRKRRSSLKPGVEETLESEISAILDEEGLDSRIGLIFPPVDVALARPPRVLIVSPRDRIDRVETLLLKPNMTPEEMEGLETKIFQEQNMSALVEGIGGVATYPSVVRESSSLRSTAVTAAHEWLHTYWFFRPLGWNFWSSSEMTTLNETAATIAGRDLGNRAYTAITGEVVEDEPDSDQEAPAKEGSNGEEKFDFNREMRRTRLRVDELLAEGSVEEAEAYMEERRQVFVENGYFIRKLNQAYFAFHGTYATSPASVSPIGDEVERLRRSTDSVGDFIRTMSGFGSYWEFEEHLSSLADSGDQEEPAALNVVPGDLSPASPRTPAPAIGPRLPASPG